MLTGNGACDGEASRTDAHVHDEMCEICRLSSVLVDSLLVVDIRLDPTDSFPSKIREDAY